MNVDEMNEAKQVLFKVLETQPGFLKPEIASDQNGADLAAGLWGFMNEYIRLKEVNVR